MWCHTSTFEEAEAGELPWVHDQLRLHSKQTNKNKHFGLGISDTQEFISELESIPLALGFSSYRIRIDTISSQALWLHSRSLSWRWKARTSQSGCFMSLYFTTYILKTRYICTFCFSGDNSQCFLFINMGNERDHGVKVLNSRVRFPQWPLEKVK